jgi:hypothetical protein
MARVPADPRRKHVDTVAFETGQHRGTVAQHGHQIGGAAADQRTSGTNEPPRQNISDITGTRPSSPTRYGGASACRIGSVAGTSYPHIEALSKVAMQTTVEEDFDRGLPILLDGIATRRARKRR